MSAVVIAATLFAGWHHATVRHGPCGQHLAQIGESVPAATGEASAVFASPWARFEGNARCEILAAADQPAETDAAPTIVVALGSIDPFTLPPPSIVEIAVALYRLAPKTSPPVA
jgi:hypothetical protein